VTLDRSSAHHGRGGTVGGGGNCAVDTGVSKQSNVGRSETMVGSSSRGRSQWRFQRGAKEK